MNKFKNSKTAYILSSILSGIILTNVVDLLFAFCGISIPIYLFIILFCVISTLLLYSFRKNHTLSVKILLIIIVIVAVICIVYLVTKTYFRNHSVYKDVDSGKASFFSEKTVFIISPHQDDEINLLSGTINEYIKYGSNVYIIFTTDGNYYGLGELRRCEALSVADYLGIPQDNIIFMDYPDTGRYSMEISFYNDQNSLTRSSFCNELKNLILDKRPDIIFCVDYDSHPDHRATSLLFEEVMGNILHESSDYTPIVLKGFAYSTGYYADTSYASYYTPNIKSTKCPYDSPYMTETNVYNWDSRIRLPVSASTLSRSIYTSSTYKLCGLYASQDMQYRSIGFIRGDRVFWQRRTDSLMYKANVITSSGGSEILTDFKLADSNNIISSYPPYDGTWIPESDDVEKSIQISFDTPVDISSICLYDNPSIEDNINDALITIDNRISVHTGQLAVNGSASIVNVNCDHVSKIEIHIVSSEGENAGLTEIECYSDNNCWGSNKFIKLSNMSDDFAYDYYISGSGEESFKLYSFNCSDSFDDYNISSNNDDCSISVKNNELLISCPLGKSSVISVSSKDNILSDSIYISNPIGLHLLQKFELLTINNRLHDTFAFKMMQLVRNR